MEIITSVAGKLAEYTVEPIWQQFVYLVGYKEHIKKLDVELKKLGEKRVGVQLLVEDAKRNAQVVGPDVVSWLEKVDLAEKDSKELLRNRIGARCVNALNLKLRYSLGKKASKMTQDIIQLLQEGNNYISNRVAFPAPPNKDYVSTSITGFTGLTSRISVMEEIMQALKNDDINMIGICGAGGIGKTKMVEEVMGRAKAEKLFEEFAMPVVSQTPDERAIQGQIADKLGLRFHEESVAGRADRLRERMMKDGKKILVILDDIWEKLDFDKVGLPLGPHNKRCKFIFTTREADVCKQMKCQKEFVIPYLPKEEAWKLFRESAGRCVDDLLLHPIAEAVADECAGLPLAIVIVGRALEKADKNVWADALQQLKKSAPSDIAGMRKYVFSRIELSYNYLESKEAKSCFLLCCLFPEDFEIPIEFLVTYGMGLKLFEYADTILEARTRVHALVDKLKRSFLLLDTDKEYHVKMHDVVRDFALTIGSKDEPMLVRCDVDLDEWPQKDSYEHYSRISLQFSKNAEFPVDSLQFTNLKLLQLFYNSRGGNHMDNIPGNFFLGMKGLAVLTWLKNRSPLSLPPSLEVLKNLRSLFLHGCSKIEGLSMIGGLEKLEILSLVGSQIRSFPREVGQLKHLKSLDLCECQSIQRIERGTLSCLSGLEELYMIRTFDDDWNINEENREEINASLIELKALSHLKVLAIQIPAYASMAREFPYDNLIKFTFYLSEETIIYDEEDRYMMPLANTLVLQERERSRVFYPLLQKTDYADLKKLMDLENDLCELDINGFARLKTFVLSSCEKLKYIVDWSRNATQGAVFPQLELLEISDLENLQEICHGQQPSKKSSPEALRSSSSTWLASFGKLRSLTLNRCPKLKYIFSMSIARGLTLLQKLHVSQCNELEVIISKLEEDDEKPINAIGLFPKLTDSKLGDLPDLRGFNSVSSRNKDVLADKKDTSTHEMEETLKGKVLIFPKLNLLELANLPNFTTFSAEGSALALSSLERLGLGKCPKVRTLDHMINTSSSLQLKSTDFTTKPSSAVPMTKTVSDGSGTSMDSYHGLSRWLSCCGSAKTTLPTGCGGPFITNSTDEMNIIQQRDVLNPNEVDQMMMMSKLVDLSIEDMDNVLYIWTDKIDGSFIPSHLMNRMNNLERMEVRGCKSLETLVDIQRRPKSVDVLPMMNCPKKLILTDLPKMEQIWKNIGHEGDFKNLKRLDVEGCDNLKYLFSSHVAELLVELEEVRVIRCNMMEEIVGKLGTDDQDDQDQSIHEKIKSTEQHGGRVLGLMFKKLKVLEIWHCDNLRHVFSGSFGTRGLEQLKELDIFYCKMMEHIVAAVANEENKEEEAKATTSTTTTMNNKIVFPQLATLFLWRLPKMERFCQGNNYVMELPSLKELAVDECPMMRDLSYEFPFDYQPMLRRGTSAFKWALRVLRNN